MQNCSRRGSLTTRLLRFAAVASACRLATISDLAQAVQITNQAAQATAGVLAEPPTSVRIQELGPDDILLEVRFWTDSRRSDVVLTSSAVRTEVVRALKAAGIGLPDPSLRTLNVSST